MKRKIGGFNESTKVKIIRENYTHYENTLQVFSIIEASVKGAPYWPYVICWDTYH